MLRVFFLSEKQIQQVAPFRTFLVIELGIAAILTIDHSELVMLQVKHLGNPRACHCHIFGGSPCASALDASSIASQIPHPFC